MKLRINKLWTPTSLLTASFNIYRGETAKRLSLLRSSGSLRPFQVLRMPCNRPLSETLWGWLVPLFHSELKDHMVFLLHFTGILIFRAWIVAFGATWLSFHYMFTKTASALHMAQMLVSTFYLLSHLVIQQYYRVEGNIVPSDQQNRSGKRAKVCITCKYTDNYQASSSDFHRRKRMNTSKW